MQPCYIDFFLSRLYKDNLIPIWTYHKSDAAGLKTALEMFKKSNCAKSDLVLTIVRFLLVGGISV